MYENINSFIPGAIILHEYCKYILSENQTINPTIKQQNIKNVFTTITQNQYKS